MVHNEQRWKLFVELPSGERLEIVEVGEEAPADEDTFILIKVKI